MKRSIIAIVLLIVFCAAALTVSVDVRRGPIHDQKISDDLENIRNAIDLSDDRLPSSLDLVTGLASPVRARLANYHYERSSGSYQLCATFLSSRVESARTFDPQYVDFSYHPKGYYCFTLQTLNSGKTD